jgi:hypothetical protein
VKEGTVAARLQKLLVVPAVVALAFAAGSCGGSGGIGATEVDYSITLDESTAPSGDVTFDISNDAEQTHEFVVFKTDLAADQLPLNEDGDVDEEGEGVTHIDEVEDIEAGATESLTVELDAGNYVVLCNLPGHYKQGMHASFTVS